MQKISTSVEALHRVVAMLVAAAVLAVSVGYYNTAGAANLFQVSNTLSDSDVSALSNHTIRFTMATSSSGVSAGGTITVTFPAGFNLGTIDFTDVDFSINGTDQALAAAAAGATWGVSTSSQVLTLTSATGVVTAGQAVVIEIGTNATFGTTGTDRVTNPTAGSYEFLVTAGTVDTGRTRVAILDNVDVTAIVNTSFTFVVTGLATSTTINGTTTTGSSTATAIPFGVLTAGVPKVLGQRLNVTTNARNGFVVTVEQDQNLLSSTGADIDGFIDGAYTNAPALWAAPTPNIAQENTWGHWGLTSADDINSNEFNTGGTRYVSASTTPRQIFGHNGPSDGTTAQIGQSDVAYAIQITPLQEAGDDYNTILTYIATPTF
ncbi:MAG: hypothetical protein RLZZ360_106 [Candidatus Parcubacteria bacterium]|jgi:hypothetical protein